MTDPRSSPTPAASARTTVRRGVDRATYDAAQIRSILHAGVIAHVGVTTPDGPIVLPMAYGIRPRAHDHGDGADPGGGDEAGHEVLLHGSLANALLRAGRSIDVCLTVTIVDGLVIARTPLHNSMNYRSVVVRGTATAVEGIDARRMALRVINDHVAAIWDDARTPSDSDVRKTLVLAIPLDEASAKVRVGDPSDEQHDLAGPHWAGVVPLTATWGPPRTAADLREDVAPPAAVISLAGSDAHAEA